MFLLDRSKTRIRSFYYVYRYNASNIYSYYAILFIIILFAASSMFLMSVSIVWILMQYLRSRPIAKETMACGVKWQFLFYMFSNIFMLTGRIALFILLVMCFQFWTLVLIGKSNIINLFYGYFSKRRIYSFALLLQYFSSISHNLSIKKIFRFALDF